MSFIYDLDNEYGGRIINPANSVNAGLEVSSNATYYPAVRISRGIIGNETSAPLVFANLSMASVPVIDFGNNFISVASVSTAAVGIGVVGQAQKVVVVRAGNINYAIPLFGLSTAVNGPGAY